MSRRGSFVAKGCPCCVVWEAFLSSGRISMFASLSLSQFISKPSKLLVVRTSDEALSSLFSLYLCLSLELRSWDN